MNIVFLIAGLVLGILIAWLWFKVQSVKIPDEANLKIESLSRELESKQLILGIETEKSRQLGLQLDEIKAELNSHRELSNRLNANLSAKNVEYQNLEDRLKTHQEEVENLQKKFTDQFQNLANQILEEKSKKFTEQNKENIDQVLKPLNEKLKDFEKKVEQTYINGVKDRTDLQAEIKKLYDLNTKISQDANNLTKALKGDVKKQGNWGEVILERILENSGLQKDREYKTQVSFNREEGGKYQPDVVIYLPENKHVIVDSKVSLVAYEQLVNASTPEDQERHLKDHIRSVKAHIKELSDKQYFKLDGLNSPEYVLMFIPIESSFSIAIREDAELFSYAWDNRIVIVSPSTLTATLMTISSIWRQENQTRNALEIAQKSGDLYDKFVLLMEDLIDVGNKLKATQKAYSDSMNKLTDGRGNLIKRVEDLKVLGAKASKSLPQNLLDRAIDVISNE
jgi:DNA recombination protein RmuC